MSEVNAYLLWLGGIFDADTLHSRPGAAPAARRWQHGMVSALGERRAVSVVGHVPEPLWPRGPLRVSEAPLAAGVDGVVLRYWNLPALRTMSLASRYTRAFDAMVRDRGRPAVVISYNAYPHNLAVCRAASERGVPWVPIVADVPQTRRGRSAHDAAIADADGRVFLSWDRFEAEAGSPKLHMEGGVARLPPAEPEAVPEDGPPVVVYTGALNKWGGVDLLIDAFAELRHETAQLWICGKGASPPVERAAAADPRIRLLGFVDEERLEAISRRASLFVNPRPSAYVENHANFPSKVLEYLSYGKPVISTWTGGLSPDYRDVLVVVEEESAGCLADAIEEVLGWKPERRAEHCRRIRPFLADGRTWRAQADRLLGWLETDVIGAAAEGAGASGTP